MNKIYNYFEKLKEEDKLTQAFIIGNVTFEEIEDELYEVLKTFFFKDCENIKENPDLYILKSDTNISKDDIKQLISDISTTSQFNSTKVYIIDKCEKLNDFAYNSILKTLEEPQKGIYAILLTTNMDAVKPTILSRCQKIFVSSAIKEEVNEEYKEVSEYLIKSIENNGINTIAKNYDIYNKIVDRNFFQNVLKYMLKKYNDKLLSLVNNKKTTEDLINTNDIVILSKKILVINNNIIELDNNLNKNLSIDRFIIEMWRCNNENSRS